MSCSLLGKANTLIFIKEQSRTRIGIEPSVVALNDCSVFVLIDVSEVQDPGTVLNGHALSELSMVYAFHVVSFIHLM